MNSRDVKTRNTKMDLELEDINKFLKRHKEGYFWVQAGRGWLLKAEPGSQGGATDPCEVSSWLSGGWRGHTQEGQPTATSRVGIR